MIVSAQGIALASITFRIGTIGISLIASTPNRSSALAPFAAIALNRLLIEVDRRASALLSAVNTVEFSPAAAAEPADGATKFRHKIQ